MVSTGVQDTSEDIQDQIEVSMVVASFNPTFANSSFEDIMGATAVAPGNTTNALKGWTDVGGHIYELVGTVDPDSTTFEQFDIAVTAGSGDGTNILQLFGTGPENGYGTYVDNIQMN